MKTVITYGTFDMFHIGHLNLIKRLKEYGDRVIVAVSTDEFNLAKGKKCVIPFDQRAQIVAAISGVDLVIPETSWEQKETDIKKHSVDTFVIGADWEGKFDHLQAFCEVVYLPRTQGVSTTELKELLKGFSPELKKNMNDLFAILESVKKELG